MGEGAAPESFLLRVLALAAPQDVAELDEKFVRALLEYGSETEDDSGCVERVGLAHVDRRDGSQAVGFALRRKRIPVADILNSAEGTPSPVCAEDFPDVTQNEWDAVLRLATLIFTTVERRV